MDLKICLEDLFRILIDHGIPEECIRRLTYIVQDDFMYGCSDVQSAEITININLDDPKILNIISNIQKEKNNE